MNKGSYNKVIILGHLGDNPDVKFTTAGTAVANLSIATNEVWKDASGKQQEKTEWHKAVVFGKRAETARDWLKKGQLILIEGKLQTRSWEDKDKVKRYSTEIICENYTMLGSKGGNSNGGGSQGSDSNYTPPDDDLPF